MLHSSGHPAVTMLSLAACWPPSDRDAQWQATDLSASLPGCLAGSTLSSQAALLAAADLGATPKDLAAIAMGALGNWQLAQLPKKGWELAPKHITDAVATSHKADASKVRSAGWVMCRWMQWRVLQKHTAQ